MNAEQTAPPDRLKPRRSRPTPMCTAQSFVTKR